MKTPGRLLRTAPTSLCLLSDPGGGPFLAWPLWCGVLPPLGIGTKYPLNGTAS